jgi:hypothetical protein
MAEPKTLSPLVPAALERLGKHAAHLRRELGDLPRAGELPADPRSAAPLIVAAEDVLDEARAVTKHLESLLAALPR